MFFFSLRSSLFRKKIEKLTFVRIKIYFHSLQVLQDNWNIHHNVQHLHHRRHDILQRLRLNGFDFDTYLDTMKSNKIAVVMAQDLQSTAMLAVYMMEILLTLPIDVVIANGANLHRPMIPIVQMTFEIIIPMSIKKLIEIENVKIFMKNVQKETHCLHLLKH